MKKIITSVLAVVFSICCLSAQDLANSGFQYLKIGNVEAVVISEGHFPFPSVQPIVAPTTDAAEVKAFLEKDNRPSTMDFGLNILLIKKGDKLILLDAGVGEAMNGHLLPSLGKMGIKPEQITDIIVSHAHFDHIAGLFSKEQKPVFGNAKLYISQVEYDFWMEGMPDFSNSKAPQEGREEMLKTTRATLNAMKPQLNMVQDGAKLYDFLSLEIAPGHTKGHMMITVSSEGENLVCISDLVHETMVFTNPRWGIAFDWDFNIGVESRVRILKQLNAEKALIFGYHLPYPGIGRLRQLATDSYEWMPKPFASPYK